MLEKKQFYYDLSWLVFCAIEDFQRFMLKYIKLKQLLMLKINPKHVLGF